MDLELDGNSALVTAASSGLGFASAQALAEEGANVAICGRTPEHLEQAEAELAATSGDLADLVRERVALLTVEK